MSLPRLRADLSDGRSVARVLRGALRHEVEVVPLSAPPQSEGQHILELDIPGEGLVTLLADPVARAGANGGQALQLRPLTRSHMATLLELVERLDEPTRSEVPPSATADDEVDADPRDSFASERTILDQHDSIVIGAKGARFGKLDSVMPSPLSVPPLPPPPVIASPVAPPPAVETKRSRDELLLGRTIAGKYLIEAPIGTGSTATVFRGMHVGIKRPVAVKVLHEQKLAERQFVKRFEAEALSASRLEHPNVTRIFDFGQEPDGLLYLVMELHAGKTLEAILSTEGKLGARRAIEIASQACSALAFAHDDGLIHRDIKPENIMIVAHRDEDGEPCELVKVCDFGLAKPNDPDANREMTTAGMLCGSPAYMSPEQTRGEKLDVRTDIYSLGVTMFEALTGELPHEANSLTELFIKIMLHPPRPLSAFLPGVDPRLEAIVMQAMATDPASRPANARVLRKALRSLVAG